MKSNLAPIFISSLLSAIIAIGLYKMFSGPEKIFVHDNAATAQYTTLNGEKEFDLLSGISQRNFLSSSPTNFISSAESVTPTVVNIKAIESGGFDFWGSGSFGASSGSGVIISPEGYIVTNNHVIEEADKYEVTLNDRREYEAKLIGTDPFTDLALLKIEADDIPFIIFGNSDSLRVGEWVLAVGNPFNLESTVTAGIVSAKGRNIDILEGEYSIESFIQTDAAVNPGNSGGALVNTNGELVGINTAIITRSGRYEGYSFAVPSNLAQKVIRDLREYGEVQRGLLGIRIGRVNSQIATELGLPSVEGVYVSNVTNGGGASEAGMKKDDVIIAVNDVRIKGIPELQEQVGRFRPGNMIKVEYIRNGKKFRTNVTLRDKDNAVGKKVKKETFSLVEELGFDLRNLTKEEVRRIRVAGVYVKSIDLGSTIESTQMDPGFIITKINDQKVTSVLEIEVTLNKLKGEKVYLEGFYENYRGEYYYTFIND